jgi:hypothetical protein
MKLSQYAKLKGISYQTARNWFNNGTIKGQKMPTGTILIDEEITVQTEPKVKKTVEIKKDLLKATHQGKLMIGEIELPCAVLEDGTRVLTQASIFRAFKRPARGNVRVINMPVFLDSKGLLPYVQKENRHDLLSGFEYVNKFGNLTRGYKAEILPIVCDIYLEARNDKALTARQEPLATMAEIIVRSLAKVGIIALVDEATGYQGDRQKDELQKILSAYISKELLPWQKRFPNEYYEQICRLRGWNFDPLSNNRPQIIGKITNQIVYKLFPDQVLDELKKLNPPNESGNRSHRFHQFLTLDIGNVNLERHLAQVIVLMRISKTWAEFEDKLYDAFPRYGQQEKIL